MFCVVDLIPYTLPVVMSSTNLYTRGESSRALKKKHFIVHSLDLFKKQRNKFQRMLLNEKFSGQSVLTRQIRRVPLTARPMDLIYFLFFAVSHYPPNKKKKRYPDLDKP